MELILYSKCIKQLDESKSQSSSEIFELGFINALSKNIKKILIISETALKPEKSIVGNVFLHPAKLVGKLNWNIKEIIEEYEVFKYEKYDERIVMLFGYDYFNLLNLKTISSAYSAKLISFTFDTHRPAIENKGKIKKKLLEIYFQKGINLLKKINGIILFNDEALRELNLNIDFHISRVGYKIENIPSEISTSNKQDDNFKILYAGSLEAHNKVLEIISVISLLEGKNVILDIYGDGNLKTSIEEISLNSNNMNYKGNVSVGELDAIISNYNLLINIRDPKDYVQKFAFPSKLIKYMASGVPVLSTRLLKDLEFEKSAYIIDDLSAEGLLNEISSIIDNVKLGDQKALRALEYVKKNFSWDDISDEVTDFLLKVKNKS